jgi:hypothetical protein
MTTDIDVLLGAQDVALVDLIDRVIGGGVVIAGDIVIGIAGVDLVYLGLRLVLAPAHMVDKTAALHQTAS